IPLKPTRPSASPTAVRNSKRIEHPPASKAKFMTRIPYTNAFHELSGFCQRAPNNLDFAPSMGDSSHASAREGLIAFTNGQTGYSNPQRQGLSSAILDGISPLQTLEELEEGQSDAGFPAYSPLWDVRLAEWTPAAVAQGLNTRQTDFGTELS